MKRLRPIYYADFHCVADACTYTCCQNWDITVDKRTEEKYRALGIGEVLLLIR